MSTRTWEREVEAVIVAGLGSLPPVLAAPSATPAAAGTLASARLSFVGTSLSPEERKRILAAARARLAPSGALVVVDHNRPRRPVAAVAAVFAGRPRPGGTSPLARWRRLAYPTARETQGAGFVVEALRLAVGERVQVVFARRRD